MSDSGTGSPLGDVTSAQFSADGHALIDWIAHYRAFWAEHIDRLEQLLENMDQ